MVEEDERRRRVSDSLRRSREVAGRLAQNADDLARTFEQAALVPDAVAANPFTALHVGAAEHAELERRLAVQEWSEGARLRRLADTGR